jgi:hypothetical protein
LSLAGYGADGHTNVETITFLITAPFADMYPALVVRLSLAKSFASSIIGIT